VVTVVGTRRARALRHSAEPWETVHSAHFSGGVAGVQFALSSYSSTLTSTAQRLAAPRDGSGRGGLLLTMGGLGVRRA
jgi:hypothetical protein